MISCSHHGDQGCVPQAASATPIASASSSRRAPALDQLARGLRERLAAPGLDLDLRGDQLARRVLAERRGVGARLELGEAVDQVVRLGVDDLELLLDREGEILRAGEDDRAPRRAPRSGSGMLRPIAASVPAHSFYRRGREICRYGSRGAIAAVVLPSPGHGLRRSAGPPGLWAVPLVAYGLLEAAWTLAERAGALAARSSRADSYVR